MARCRLIIRGRSHHETTRDESRVVGRSRSRRAAAPDARLDGPVRGTTGHRTTHDTSGPRNPMKGAPCVESGAATDLSRQGLNSRGGPVGGVDRSVAGGRGPGLRGCRAIPGCAGVVRYSRRMVGPQCRCGRSGMSFASLPSEIRCGEVGRGWMRNRGRGTVAWRACRLWAVGSHDV